MATKGDGKQGKQSDESDYQQQSQHSSPEEDQVHSVDDNQQFPSRYSRDKEIDEPRASSGHESQTTSHGQYHRDFSTLTCSALAPPPRSPSATRDALAPKPSPLPTPHPRSPDPLSSANTRYRPVPLQPSKTSTDTPDSDATEQDPISAPDDDKQKYSLTVDELNKMLNKQSLDS